MTLSPKKSALSFALFIWASITWQVFPDIALADQDRDALKKGAIKDGGTKISESRLPKEKSPRNYLGVGRFNVGLKLQGTRVRLDGLQDYLGDTRKRRFSVGANLVVGYRFDSKFSAQIGFGRESYEHIGDGKNDSFNGKLTATTHPLFLFGAYDIWTSGGGASFGEVARMRYALQGALGAGLGFNSSLYGYNDFNELIQTARFTQYGAAAKAELFIGRDNIPVGLSFLTGYRLFPDIELGSTGYKVNMGGFMLGFSLIFFI